MAVHVVSGGKKTDSVFALGLDPKVAALLHLAGIDTVAKLATKATAIQGDFENLEIPGLPVGHTKPILAADEVLILKALGSHPATKDEVQVMPNGSDTAPGSSGNSKVSVKLTKQGISWKKI